MAFSPPQGITFYTEDEVAVTELCTILRRVAVFLQGLQVSSPPLRLYHDWWEHDGLHFERRAITFHDLFAMVKHRERFSRQRPMTMRFLSESHQRMHAGTCVSEP